MRVGYVRISTDDGKQKTDRQDMLMENLGVERVYTDKCSGTTSDRPGLKAMMDFVREGDVVVVESISRLARSVSDLLRIMQTLADKKVEFVSQKEAFDTGSPQGRFVLIMFGALAELEAQIIGQRRREGIEAARARGVYKGRVPIKVNWVEFERLYKLWKNGDISAVAMQREMGLGARTFYRKVKEFEKTFKL